MDISGKERKVQQDRGHHTEENHGEAAAVAPMCSSQKKGTAEDQSVPRKQGAEDEECTKSE